MQVSEEFHLQQLVSEPTRQHRILGPVRASLVIQVLSFLVKHLMVLVIMRLVLLLSNLLVRLVYQRNLQEKLFVQ